MHELVSSNQMTPSNVVAVVKIMGFFICLTNFQCLTTNSEIEKCLAYAQYQCIYIYIYIYICMYTKQGNILQNIKKKSVVL